MRKVVNIIFIGMLLMGICLLTGCGNESGEKNPGNEQSKIDETVKELEPGETKVDLKDNIVSIMMNNGTGSNITEYIFENDKLVSGRIIEEYESEEITKLVYDNVIKEEALYIQYKEIKLNGKSIEFYMKDEVISFYKDMNKDSFYEFMKNSYANQNEVKEEQ